MDTKLSNLTAVSAIADADLFYAVQSTASRKVTGTQLKTYVAAGVTSTINVWNYLSAAQKTDVGSWTANLDVTTPINNAIAALPSTGGVLYFPAGRYKTTGGFTLSVPCTIRGDGKSVLSVSAPTVGVTQIECGTDAVNVFTFATTGVVKDLGIVDTIVATRTSGDAIVVYNASDFYQRVDLTDCLIFGFYKQFNGRVTNSCHITNNDLESALEYSIVLDNEVLSDAGDNIVSNNAIYPGYSGKTATAAIRVRNGGNKIIGNAIVENGGDVTYGILADIRAATSQLLITSNKIETVTDNCVKITYPSGSSPSHLNYVNITGNILATSSGSAGAIYFDRIGVFTIGSNNFAGGGTYAIDTAGIHASGAILPNGSTGFTNYYDASTILTNSTKVYWDADPLYIGPSTASGISLDNLSGSLSIKQGDNSTPAEVFSAKFLTVGSSSGRPSDTDSSFAKAYNSGTSGNFLALNSNGANYGVMGVDSGGDWWYGGTSSNGLNATLTGTAFRWTQNNNFIAGPTAALATNAANGFLYIPTCAGTPTGTPTAYTGKVAMVYDTTNNKFYIYNGAWKGGTNPGVFT